MNTLFWLKWCLLPSMRRQALFHAVGLGQGAIPMAAALNWIIKDGLGQLGGGKEEKKGPRKILNRVIHSVGIAASRLFTPSTNQFSSLRTSTRSSTATQNAGALLARLDKGKDPNFQNHFTR